MLKRSRACLHFGQLRVALRELYESKGLDAQEMLARLRELQRETRDMLDETKPDDDR